MGARTARAPFDEDRWGWLVGALKDWRELAKNLAELKPEIEREMDLRKSIAGVLSEAPEGTTNLEFTGLLRGWYAKVVKKQTYTLKDDRSQTRFALDELRRIGTQEHIIASLVSWEPTLSVSAYKLLSEDEQRCFTDALSIKPGAPTIELVVPADVELSAMMTPAPPALPPPPTAPPTGWTR